MSFDGFGDVLGALSFEIIAREVERRQCPAGLDGIKEKIEPAEMTTGNAYESETADPIPTDLRDAIQLARGSDWLKNIIGDDLYEIALQQSERELELFSQQVTPFELNRYRDVF